MEIVSISKFSINITIQKSSSPPSPTVDMMKRKLLKWGVVRDSSWVASSINLQHVSDLLRGRVIVEMFGGISGEEKGS
jgi:hypothetical protein